MQITNNSPAALTLPNGVTLEPKVPKFVRNWDEVKENAVVKAWIRARILTVAAPVLQARRPRRFNMSLTSSEGADTSAE